MITEEIYNKLLPYKELMAKIIINQSCSNVPIEYKNIILNTMKARGVSLCNCSSGIMNGTARLYQDLLNYEGEKNKKEQELKNRTTNDKSNIKNNKRKPKGSL